VEWTPRDVTCEIGSLVVTGHFMVGATRSHLGDLMVSTQVPPVGLTPFTSTCTIDILKFKSAPATTLICDCVPFRFHTADVKVWD